MKSTKLSWVTFAILFFSCTVNVESRATGGKKDRVADVKLSEEEPGSQEYDHDAFLGQGHGHDMDNLAPEDAKKALSEIVLQIDTDNNGQVTIEEMKFWIGHSKNKRSQKEVEQRARDYDENNDGYVSWEEYNRTTYGFLTDEEIDKEEEEHGVSYRKMLNRDKRRWEKADRTGDGLLSLEELYHFMFPEDYDFMKSVVAIETFEDIDKNGDNGITLDEYIGDLYSPVDGLPEPDWVNIEKEQFKTIRDKDGDSKLNLEEVTEWIFPENYDHVDAEAQHLLVNSDDNKDGSLTMEEILEHYDNFVGSQITGYGDDLKQHDEF